jgi:hypothetical protein
LIVRRNKKYFLKRCRDCKGDRNFLIQKLHGIYLLFSFLFTAAIALGDSIGLKLIISGFTSLVFWQKPTPILSQKSDSIV